MLTCNINTQSTSPLNTKETSHIRTQKPICLRHSSLTVVTIHSLSQVGTLPFVDCPSDWHVLTAIISYTELRITVDNRIVNRCDAAGTYTELISTVKLGVMH